MKKEEVRIGNFVNRRYTSDEIRPDVISGYDLWHSEKEDNPIHAVEWQSISPIPLTKEWVLKLGFTHNSIYTYYWKGWGRNGVQILKYSKHYKKYILELGIGLNKVLNYVHELQNLYYALTGEELTIKE